MEDIRMSNTSQSLASQRIASLLDENSFVEIGGQITARSKGTATITVTSGRKSVRCKVIVN